MDEQQRTSRRDLLRKAGVAGVVAWTTPLVLSSPAQAQATGLVAPAMVPSSFATAYDGPSGLSSTVRSITLTSTGLQAGDLWVALVAFDSRSSIGMPVGPGWTIAGPYDRGVITGGEPNYSVRAYLVYRTLAPGDLVGGTFSQTFSTPNVGATLGGLRGIGFALRGDGVMVPSITGFAQTDGTGPIGGGNVVTAGFPALAPAPSVPNRVLRLGVGRGYGGCNALSPDNEWLTAPGSQFINYKTGNEGDRPMVATQAEDGTGAAANGTWYTQAFGLCNRTPNWITFTLAVQNV